MHSPLVKNISIHRILSVLMLLYSFTNITQIWYPISLNRVLTCGMIGCLIVIFIHNLNRLDILLLFSLGGCFAISSANSDNLIQNIGDYIYFTTAILFLRVLANKQEREKIALACRNNTRLLIFTTYSSVTILFISLFFSNSYQYVWGNDIKYFCGLLGTPHVMASSICLIMAMVVLTSVSTNFRVDKVTLLFLLLYTVFMTGARTFAVPATLIIIIYINNTSTSIKQRYIRFIAAACLIVVCFFFSPMTNKFASTFVESGDGEVLFNQVSNGRISIWSCLMDAYLSESLIFQLFGVGFEKVYSITEEALGVTVWAHNDFLYLLVGSGAVGVAAYLIALVDLFKSFLKQDYLIYALAMIVYLLFPAIMNGWFTYFHLVMSFVVLTLCCNHKYKQSAKSCAID